MDILKYNGYEGTAELDMGRMICRGKILFIDDLITYEADTPAALQKEFEDAVDDYLETCESLGRQPQKPLQGVFQVRVSPEQHKAAVRRSLTENLKLNELMCRALDAYLIGQPIVTNNVQVTFSLQEEHELKTVFASTDGTRWEKGNARVH